MIIIIISLFSDYKKDKEWNNIFIKFLFLYFLCVIIMMAVYHQIENAIKYNTENGRVIVTISERNGKSVIRVEDNGKGISKEEQKKIFEPFYRVDKSRSRSLGGYGIGLAMVSEIMDTHGGAIELEKSDENGSIFCLVL